MVFLAGVYGMNFDTASPFNMPELRWRYGYLVFWGVGLVVGVGMLDIGIIQYYNETVKAVNLWNLGIGLFSGIVFGVIVALSGCMRGMQCGRSASAVGEAATSAVVTAIVGIILSTALITVLCNLLGI